MEIIKEVFPDDADENKVKDLVARISLARKSMVCLRNYLQEAASYEMKMVSVARRPVRTRRLRKYLRPTVHAELKEEQDKSGKKPCPQVRTKKTVVAEAKEAILEPTSLAFARDAASTATI